MMRFLELAAWNWVVGEVVIWTCATVFVVWLFWKVGCNITVFQDIVEKLSITGDQPKWKKTLDWAWWPMVWPFFVPKNMYKLYRKAMEIINSQKIGP